MAENEEFLAWFRSALEVFERIRESTIGVVQSRVQRRTGLGEADRDAQVEKIYQKIWAGILGFDFEKARKVISWILTIADHAIVDYLRTSPTGKDLWEIPDDDAPGALADERTGFVDQKARRDHDLPLLLRAVIELSTPNRQLMALMILFWDKPDYKKIADDLGLPDAGAARQLRYNTVIELTKRLAEMGVGEDIMSMFDKGLNM